MTRLEAIRILTRPFNMKETPLDEFSEKYDFRKPNYFYIGNVSFKVSHVRKVVESEE